MTQDEPNWSSITGSPGEKIKHDLNRKVRYLDRLRFVGGVFFISGLLLGLVGGVMQGTALAVCGVLVALVGNFVAITGSLSRSDTMRNASMQSEGLFTGSQFDPHDIQRKQRELEAVESWLCPRAKVFLSYRRKDSAFATERIYDRLVERYGRESVFKDVDSIPLGSQFRDTIQGWIAISDVVVVVIGQGWLTATAASGSRRLDDESDYVRNEIETAIAAQKLLIPLLIENANIPAGIDLPASLRNLVSRNVLCVRPDPDFERDVQRLIQAIDQSVNPGSELT